VTQLIKKVAANRTVLMVEHNMNVIATIADTITVLQRGQVIARAHTTSCRKIRSAGSLYGTAEAELQGAHG